MVIFFASNTSANSKVKIGLVVPLSGENKELGESILKSVRLAINDIDDNKIIIVPKDNRGSANQTLQVSKELYDEGVKIIIGPIFKKNTLELYKLKES